ncbi:hypothetical protein GCM10008090_23460 [Arenicella chitinivorans]|uniref:Putative DNA-binding domain-containing protein n=1 Tax=Arenicella chitinivorans TaxID=1329800 RepID=A0A918RUD0_9GAMM|nr:DUF692 family multinuclear iron-containing protein [Arenicella chitinivorans]GHA13062.1 hypothetical protein GCM10008090_23460 [Arenicella chitinivorans]
MKSGLGIRAPLFQAVVETKPDLGFFEAHSENYFGSSPARDALVQLRQDYPISLHGVGLSLGRADELDRAHLRALKGLADDVDPLLVSEHLAWSAYAHRHVPDLLPLPLTESSLGIMCEHIDQMQSVLGRQVLIENPSNYLLFDYLQIPEAEFLNELASRTGCGLLVDVNNVYVSATNMQRDPKAYLATLNPDCVQQYHLAGHTVVTRDTGDGSETMLIDTHDHTITDDVWALYRYSLTVLGHKPTLIEWDSALPPLGQLCAECDKADAVQRSVATVTQRPNVNSAPVASSPVSLGAHQTQFLDALLGGDRGAPGVDLSHQHRVTIYRNNVQAAVHDYLAEVFPATLGVVGEGFFRTLVQATIVLSPPANGDIHRYGSALGDLDIEGMASMPYLRDLIAYEWALHRAYFASIDNTLNAHAMPQDEVLTIPVKLNASVHLIESAFPIFEIRRQSLPDYADPVSIHLGQSQDTVLVYKCRGQVVDRCLEDHETLFFKQLKKSTHLLQAIEALHGSIEEHTLATVLGFCFDQDLLVNG